jgi:hypothetical protein
MVNKLIESDGDKQKIVHLAPHPYPTFLRITSTEAYLINHLICLENPLKANFSFSHFSHLNLLPIEPLVIACH